MEKTVPLSQRSALKPERLAGLDGLRFIAALLALAYHYLFRGFREGGYLSVGFEPYGNALQYAYFGVPLFFMISGFVILWSTENKNWFEFAAGRIIRLWPAYLFAVTLTASVIALLGAAPFNTSLSHWLFNLTFFAPAFGHSFMDGVYWTIVLEIIFYGWVMIGVMTGILSRSLVMICLAWMVLIVANEMWLESGALRFVGLTRYGPWFLVGVLSYQLWSTRRSPTTVMALAVAVELTMFNGMVEHTELAQTYNYAVDFHSILLVNGACVGVFLATIYWGGKVRPSRALFALGGITYPLYLIHQNIGYILIERMTGIVGKWGAVCLTTTLMLAVAYAIFTWWERPMARAMKRWFAPADAWRKRLLETGLAPRTS